MVFLGLFICGWFDAYILKQSNLHYTCAITPKGVTSGGARLRCLTFEETSQRWWAVNDTVSDLTNPGIEPQTSRTDSDVLIQNVKIKSSLSSENQTYSYGL